MVTPQEFRASFVLTSGTTYKNCYFSNALPGSSYMAVAEFGYATNYWVGSKSTSGCVVSVNTANGGEQPFNLYVYYDDKSFES